MKGVFPAFTADPKQAQPAKHPASLGEIFFSIFYCNDYANDLNFINLDRSIKGTALFTVEGV
jgi:hypothetical protein